MFKSFEGQQTWVVYDISAETFLALMSRVKISGRYKSKNSHRLILKFYLKTFVLQ